MPRASRENPEIRDFILKHIESHPHDISALAAKTFGISRVASSGYLRRLEEKNLITVEGVTSKRHYRLKELAAETFPLRLSKNLEEDVVWRHKIFPHLAHLRPNVSGICEYGFNEMLNNAIDHSASMNAVVSYALTCNSVKLWVIDEGVGIFEKIQRDFKLSDPRSALLELSKGRLTSDPENHAGEGIFFTSRMFDRFTIKSGFLVYLRERKNDDEWLVETHDLLDYHKGTAVGMTLSLDADWTTRDVFTAFEGEHGGFRKTHVPISLSQYPGESLVSRSQAKRLLSRFDRFSEVMLDFRGVKTIGQAFADEIFRVFKNNHPDIRIVTVNTTPDIDRMIRLAESS